MGVLHLAHSPNAVTHPPLLSCGKSRHLSRSSPEGRRLFGCFHDGGACVASRWNDASRRRAQSLCRECAPPHIAWGTPSYFPKTLPSQTRTGVLLGAVTWVSGNRPSHTCARQCYGAGREL